MSDTYHEPRPMHPAEVATLGEWLGRIIMYGKTQGTFSLTLVLDEAGEWSAALLAGFEPEDTCTAEVRLYSAEKTAAEALRVIAVACRL